MNISEILKKYETHPEFLGLKINTPLDRGYVDDTPLHIAARKGDLDDLRAFIEYGVNLDIEGDLGNTPLHQACLCGQLDSAKILVEAGADIKKTNEFHQTPLQVAKLGSYLHILDYLVNLK